MRLSHPLINRLHRRKDGSQRGFSLIELIIVIVILGILIAIAIPVYNNIQKKARDNALKTAAANGASQAVAALADGATVNASGELVAPTGGTVAPLSKLQSGDVQTVKVANTTPASATTDNVCVSAFGKGGDSNTWYSGPGAAADGKSCS